MKFRKKPVVIEAFQFTGEGDNNYAITQWCGGRFTPAHEEYEPDEDGKGCPAAGAFISIDTLEGTMTASLGDWIIRGVKGEFYPCKPIIFDATYEKVE